YDPFGDSRFGGYYQSTLLNGNQDKTIGRYNPLAVLEQRRHPNNSFRFLGNAEFDYKMHFLPELRAVVNLGLDANRAQIKEVYSDNAIATYQFNTLDTNPNTNYLFNPGKNYQENQTITNTTMDAYLAYAHEVKNSFVSKFDLQGGYSYQNFKNDGNKQNFQYNTVSGIREAIVNPQNPNNRYFNELNLQSFFGRANIDLASRYLFTFSFRADGSSLFNENNRWGYFPAAAFAWRINQEGFLKGATAVNDLKLRLGAGKTGQQDITQVAGYYPSIPLFDQGANSSQYLSGTNLYSAKAYNPDLTWEKTITYNAGIDWDLFKDSFFTGSFDIYRRETKDLLAIVPLPPGQGLSDTFIKNVGETESKGMELTLGIKPISTDKATLQFSGNVAYNRTEVTNLEDVTSITDSNSRLPIQTGLFLSRHAVGFQPTSAWVFQQLYDADGKVIVGSYVDRNGDNQIRDADRYYKALRPNWTYGFAMNFNYGNWDLSASFRGQFDGYVYNALKAGLGYTDRAIPQNSNSLSNVLNFYDGAANPDYQNLNSPKLIFTDYFLEKAAFLRCENIVLGYKFNKFYKDSSIRIYGSVSNPFIITNYGGQDPENFNGIDNNT
ncbi:MAG: TonB-dependent receptor, partial [Pedobacter sp.]